MRISNTQLAYALILAGLLFLAAFYVGLPLAGWRMPFPYSFGVIGLVSMPAVGLALLYLQATSPTDITGEDDDE